MGNAMRIGFVGAGKMAEAMVRRLLESNSSFPVSIAASARRPERAAEWATAYPDVSVTLDSGDCVTGADVVVLCVKPAQLTTVAVSLVGKLPESCVVISILAGVQISRLEETLRHRSVVRAMPNTPGQIGQGITGWCASSSVLAYHLELSRTVLGTLGEEIYFQEEELLDIVTAVSGSGPGLVYEFMEGVEDAAVQLGMPRDISKRLVIQMVLGSAAYANARPEKNFAALRHEIVSPGGTTAQGSFILHLERFRAGIIKAVVAMWDKCRELGKPKA